MTPTLAERAFALAQSARPDLTKAELEYALTIAKGETGFGQGWGSDPLQGAGSHNWGAVQGEGPAGSFVHQDVHADGVPYFTAFKRYNSDAEGFNDMANILLKPNVKAALKKRSLKDAVTAQHANGYFELALDKYLSAVQKNYTELSNELGWDNYLTLNGSSLVKIFAGAFVIGSGAFLLSRRH